MICYHVTSKDRMRSIKRRGILPHEKIPHEKCTFPMKHLYNKPGREKSVYLITTGNAFSMIREYIRYVKDNNDRIPVVIEIDLPKDIPYVEDEFYFNNYAIRTETVIPPEWIKRIILVVNDEPIL